jgi:hypothetical protein
MASSRDSNAKDRAERLATLRREATEAIGCGEAPSAADAHQIEQIALLKLAHEAIAARLVAGGTIDSTELIQLNEAVSALLPAPSNRGPKAIAVTFVDAFDVKLERLLQATHPDMARDVLVKELSGRITELEPLERRVDELRAENERLQRAVADLTAELRALRGEPVDDGARSVPDQDILPPPQRKLPPPPPERTWDPSLQIVSRSQGAPGCIFNDADPSGRQRFGDVC